MSILASLFGAGDEQARGDALDAQLAALNAQDYGPGGKYYTPENWAKVQADESSGATGNVDAQIGGAFAEGAQEGFNNVTNFVQNSANTLTKGIFQLIPWQVWLIGAGALFVWMGGLELLRGKFAK